MISRYPSYHGATLGALSVTGMTNMTAPFAPMMRQMPKIPAPTCYLDRDDLSPQDRGLRYAEMLGEAIRREGPETVLAFLVEPIGGAATGALVPPDSYLPRVREICDQYGVLLIYDEVMTGAGRTGKFLGGDHWPAARPDIVALSKGFAAGYAPLGAMVADDRLVQPVLDGGGFVHGYTYAGNPLACAAGLAVLAEIERQNLVARAQQMGDLLQSELRGLMGRYPFIGDVRGKGLLLAFELVADRETMAPLPAEKAAFVELVEQAYARKLIIYSRRTRGGVDGDHFMVCPPLIVERSQIAEIMEKLTGALDAFAAKAGLPLES